MQCGKEVVAFGGESCNRPAAIRVNRLNQRVVLGREEPDSRTIGLELRGHGACMPVLGTVEAEHHRHVRRQGLPEFGFKLLRGMHTWAPLGARSETRSVPAGSSA